ncbi:MAG: deoxyhypusine synthase family protein [Thermoplasmata archaeon]|nr:deoxyhypusine synthase family protein [Thermoplasmata archaeon]
MTEKGDPEEFNPDDLPPIVEPVPRKGLTVKELVENYGGMAFNARRLARAADIWLSAVRDKETRIYFTFAAAMVPAGLRRVVATAMEKGLIHAIATTGSNMSHDGLQAFNMPHKRGSEEADDSVLRDEKILRIHDVFIPRKEWDEYDYWLEEEFYPDLAKRLGEDEQNKVGKAVTITPKEFFFELGKYFAEEKGDDGILATAYRNEIPIFCPAFTDCTYGVTLEVFNRLHSDEMGYSLRIDQTRGFSQLVDDMAEAKKKAVVVVGGGTPKNYVFQTSEALSERGLTDILPLTEEQKKGFHYAIQITTDMPVWGGLSGATLKEAISWKKVDTEARRCVVYCDATIALPLVIQYVLDSL